MVGENIVNRVKEKTIVCIFSFFILLSCNSKTNKENIEVIVKDYINNVKAKDLKLNINKYMVRVNIDSSNIGYQSYRIYMEPFLLEKKELPSEINLYDGFKISYFKKNISNNKDKKNMIEKLQEANFYQEEDTNYLSNYPEWVILTNKKSNKKIIVKDMWYYPLDSIIKKYKNKIE